MTKRHKTTLYRIVGTFAALLALLGAEYAGLLRRLPEICHFLFYFVPYLVIGFDVLRRAWRGILQRQVFNEYFLMSLATLAAFGLGIWGEGEYPEALAVMLFYQIGELFQSHAVEKSRQSIAALMALVPESVWREEAGDLKSVDPEDVLVGDIIVVKPGEKIPLDGRVLSGESFLDTSALTGEARPKRVGPGDAVVSGCLNGASALRVEVSAAYEDSTVAHILDLVENAGLNKAKIEGFVTRFARIYTPLVTVAAVLLAVLTPFLGIASWAEGLRRACNFLIVSCPCALVLSVPLGFFGGIGAASRLGVLVKGADALENAAALTTLVLDKTGTLTTGRFGVTELVPLADGLSSEVLLELAAHGESCSTHPVALSIREAWGRALDPSRVKEMIEHPGYGIEATLDDKRLLLGKAQLLEMSGIAVPHDQPGRALVHVAHDNLYQGYLVIEDAPKPQSGEAMAELRAAGITRTVMLTGDAEENARVVADALGVDEVQAGLLPDGKVEAVERLLAETRRLSTRARLGFVGDGINDAPVLMRADVGFAMGGLGSDAAIEAADIVILDDDPRKVAKVIRLARATLGIVRANIALALGVKAGILALSTLGLASMWAAVFGDVGVSVLCVLNSMRTLGMAKRV